MGSCMADTELWQRALEVRYDRLRLPGCDSKGVEVLLRRDDLIDAHCSGNKYYKLFYNLKLARQAGAKRLITAGGAWSNHLYALAHAARDAGFSCRALVRGERPATLSSTLQDAENAGMELEFISRGEYRLLSRQGPEFLEPDDYFIPEGGANSAGERGAQILGKAIAATIPRTGRQFVCLAVGTGGTFKGVTQALPASIPSVGISVLKGPAGSSVIGSEMGSEADADIAAVNWRLLWGFAAGGYAKKLPESLLAFWRDFEQDHQIPLDPVYTLKTLHAVDSLARQGYWPRNSRVIVIHTGGLQGRRGFAAQIDWPHPPYSFRY